MMVCKRCIYLLSSMAIFLTLPFSVSFYKGISVSPVKYGHFGPPPKMDLRTADQAGGPGGHSEWLTRFCLVVWIVQPIPSTYGIFTCIWLIFMENECRWIYKSSHGSCAREKDFHFGVITLLQINISPKKALLKMIWLFPRWDVLVPGCVSAMDLGLEKILAWNPYCTNRKPNVATRWCVYTPEN